jgi:formylglycine-generating enzyme required for sulfatase activity
VFLQALAALQEQDSKKAKQFDHPDQPGTLKSHRPEQWAQTLAAARGGGVINNQRVDLNCPAVDVTWWDAFAYARWKGRHLPTEEQWEKAARGPEGRHYPWGEKDDPGAANLKDTSTEKAGDKAHAYGEPVNRHKKDASFYGVLGMAGNVEEWTGSWVNHPDYPDVLVPVVRGGDFATKSSDGLLTDRHPSKSPDQHTLLRGFRTVSDKAPPPEPKKP